MRGKIKGESQNVRRDSGKKDDGEDLRDFIDYINQRLWRKVKRLKERPIKRTSLGS